ncbi:MAG: LysM peptidoglycan-binding domain-containing protein [Endomicrobiia bacterium]
MRKIKFFIIIFTVILFSYHIINSVEHIVVKGDCLWNIAKFYYKNPFLWKKIYESNKEQISNPDLIYPGQKFFIPDFKETAKEDESQTEIPGIDTTQKDTIQTEKKESISLQAQNITEKIENDIADELQIQQQKKIEKQEFIIEENIKFTEEYKSGEVTKTFPKKIKYDKSKISGVIKNAKEKKFVYVDFDTIYCEIKNNDILKKDDILGIYHLGPSEYNTSLMNVPEDELNLVGIIKIKEIDEKNSMFTGEILRCYSPIVVGDLVLDIK